MYFAYKLLNKIKGPLTINSKLNAILAKPVVGLKW